MKIRALFLTPFLVNQKRRGSWVYLLWLCGYCTLAFGATTYAAVLGQDYMGAFLFLLVPAVFGYVQFRFPTTLGWFLLFLPTAVFGCIAVVLAPVAVIDSLSGGEIIRALTTLLLLLLVAGVLWGFIHYRPFWRKNAA
jgi:F0F1-type ATP synthase assembly protein I